MERPDTRGLRPLHAAVYDGSYQHECAAESIRLLLGAGADPNALTEMKDGTANPDGTTPLMQAAQKGCMEAVQALLDGGAVVSMAHTSGQTAADYASARGHGELAVTLREAAASS